MNNIFKDMKEQVLDSFIEKQAHELANTIADAMQPRLELVKHMGAPVEVLFEMQLQAIGAVFNNVFAYMIYKDCKLERSDVVHSLVEDLLTRTISGNVKIVNNIIDRLRSENKEFQYH